MPITPVEAADANGGQPLPTTAPTTEALERKATDVLTRAHALVVDSPDADINAVEFLRGVKQIIAEIETAMAPVKASAKRTHDEACALERRLLEAPRSADKHVRSIVADYRAIVERKALAIKQAEAAEQRKIAEEARLVAVHAAQASGDIETAKVLVSAPVYVPLAKPTLTQSINVAAPSTKTWSAEVTDLFALVAYIVGHPEEIGLILANGPALNKRAVALKDKLAIPGVKSVSKAGLSLREAKT